MSSLDEKERARKTASAMLLKTGIAFRPDEIERIEVADFGLNAIEESGGQILTLVNTEKIAAKLLVMLPGQRLPEHRHPPLDSYPGKEETIRCEWGVLYLYGPGEPTINPKGTVPVGRESTYTVWHEYILQPGEQVTFPPNTLHWFQGGPEGAVIWSFSTKAVDIKDIFTDLEIIR
jgi:D-lyxose ketol-isomerase